MNETSTYDPEAFREFERSGWNGAAGEYNDLFGVITAQAVPSLLDAVDARFGTRLLDLGLRDGGGLSRGAHARMHGGGDRFRPRHGRPRPPAAGRGPSSGTATRRRCPSRMSASTPWRATSASCISRIPKSRWPRPRVFWKSGGKLAFTAWTHDAGHRALMARAIQEHGDTSVPLVAGPPAPFPDDDEKCARAFEEAGFTAPKITGFTLYMGAEEPGRIIEVFEKSTVRTASRLNSQTPEAREKIREALVEMLREYESEGTIQVPMQARLISAQKK